MQQKFWHDRNSGTLNFEYRVSVNGVPYTARHAICAASHRFSGVPLEAVWARMRHDLMRRIELDLFKE